MLKDATCKSTLQDSVALTEQIRCLSVERLYGKIGRFSNKALFAVEAGISYVLDMP